MASWSSTLFRWATKSILRFMRMHSTNISMRPGKAPWRLACFVGLLLGVTGGLAMRVELTAWRRHDANIIARHADPKEELLAG